MKTRGLIDLYLPRKVAYHVKMIIGSALVTAFLNLIKGIGIYGYDTPAIFFLFLIQFEIYIWIGTRFFNVGSTVPVNRFLRRIILRLIIFYILVVFIAAFIMVSFNYLIYWYQGMDTTHLLPDLLNRESRGFIIGFSGGVLFGTLVFFYFQWLDALKREQKLTEDKLIFRYETLKNQVRPHFLFNSLNTLSSLVTGNIQAEGFIQKLSGLYRYMLDNLEKDKVNLEEELSLARDYFFLRQIRDGDKISLQMEPQTMGGYYILPVSLQILIENALKHNSATRESPLKIIIRLEEHDYISVSNNLQKKMNLEKSGGLGLKNLGERLRLSTGRELIISEADNQYRVKIPLIKN